MPTCHIATNFPPVFVWCFFLRSAVWSFFRCFSIMSRCKKKYLPGSSSRDLVWTDKWPFRGLSDLNLGNQKVTLKKLAYIIKYGKLEETGYYFGSNTTNIFLGFACKMLGKSEAKSSPKWCFDLVVYHGTIGKTSLQKIQALSVYLQKSNEASCDFEDSGVLKSSSFSTWRIIPSSKWLVTYGLSVFLRIGLWEPQNPNAVQGLTGMIVQVGKYNIPGSKALPQHHWAGLPGRQHQGLGMMKPVKTDQNKQNKETTQTKPTEYNKQHKLKNLSNEK